MPAPHLSCPMCPHAIEAGSRVVRYQFTTQQHRTVVAWVHVQCTRGFALRMAKSVRVLGRNGRRPGTTNILAL